MHLGNEALTPECSAIATGVAIAGLGIAAWAARREVAPPQRWLAAGVYGGAIFAAQMVNVPLLPYSSGHLVGGVLLAAALGPGLGALTMSIVLLLQAVLLGDGGLNAIGANIINMALLPAGVVALTQHWLKADARLTTRSLALGAAAMLSVLLAAGLIVLEVALFRTERSQWMTFAGEMLQAHLVIGLAEGVATALVVYCTTGNLVGSNHREFVRRAAVAGGTALLLLTLGLPLTVDALPDGYEASVERSNWSQLLAESSSSLALWQQQVASSVQSWLQNEQLIALAATCLAAAICLLTAKALQSTPRLNA